MKVAIDILTPKQCMLFSKLSERLEAKGHKVLRTTRKYREVNQLLALKGVDAQVVGEHGGGNIADKLRASAQRILELSLLMEQFNPDVAVSFSSPELARVAFGLRVPHICINDSPHAEAVAKLTVPLSTKLLTPKIISKKMWTKYGISPKNIIRYNALDPWVWLKDYKPNLQVLKQLNLVDSKPIVTLRTEESFASYLLYKTSTKETFVSLISWLSKKWKDIQIVVVPRYEEQKKDLIHTFNSKINVCKSVVDGPSLLHYTSVFVGGGGTMTAESALLGVPTFSCYPNKPFAILKFLAKNNLISLIRNPYQLMKKIELTLRNLEEAKKIQREKAQKMVYGFEDPIEIIISEIEKLG